MSRTTNHDFGTLDASLAVFVFLVGYLLERAWRWFRRRRKD